MIFTCHKFHQLTTSALNQPLINNDVIIQIGVFRYDRRSYHLLCEKYNNIWNEDTTGLFDNAESEKCQEDVMQRPVSARLSTSSSLREWMTEQWNSNNHNDTPDSSLHADVVAKKKRRQRSSRKKVAKCAKSKDDGGAMLNTNPLNVREPADDAAATLEEADHVACDATPLDVEPDSSDDFRCGNNSSDSLSDECVLVHAHTVTPHPVNVSPVDKWALKTPDVPLLRKSLGPIDTWPSVDKQDVSPTHDRSSTFDNLDSAQLSTATLYNCAASLPAFQNRAFAKNLSDQHTREGQTSDPITNDTTERASAMPLEPEITKATISDEMITKDASTSCAAPALLPSSQQDVTRYLAYRTETSQDWIGKSLGQTITSSRLKTRASDSSCHKAPPAADSCQSHDTSLRSAATAAATDKKTGTGLKDSTHAVMSDGSLLPDIKSLKVCLMPKPSWFLAGNNIFLPLRILETWVKW